MDIETRLKDLILQKYGTMKDFSSAIGIPNSTLANIMRRGIQNANVLNIIKICQALGISTDALAEGNIVPLTQQPKVILSVESIIDMAKMQIIDADSITLNGKELDQDQIRSILLSMDMVLDLEKKRQENK